MNSPSSASSSSSLSSSWSTSPVNSDCGFPSDSEREDKGVRGSWPDPVGPGGGARPSPGPIRCKHRLKVSSPHQHRASHSEQQQRGSGIRRSREGELETDGNGQSCTTEGDLLFAQKCKELQGFIRPLTDLLNGLKMGRFERGLSSFQQSVAMDRIQRIVGVLQKPHMGERYLGTLLQVEGMLKTWFPHVAVQSTSLGGRRQPLAKHLASLPSDSAASAPAPAPETTGQAQLGHMVFRQPWRLPEWPAMNLTWIHTAPICNPPLSSPGTISFSHGPLGTGTSIGVILWLQHGGQLYNHSAPATPVPPTVTPPAVPSEVKKLSGEGSRCHSLPVTMSSDWSCNRTSPGLCSEAKEMTTGRLEQQMRSHPLVAPASCLNP
ncbi:circadian-associated transcriptional repressor [Ochotona curzoniae]|uniref:circadian-associated transcriptional repressor n=1 Tax=Ochotona curzoniae TaxID=130825 RepID=UPI001B34DBBA|nr:circadian-associated transcriptional repressor [Ochotona curzoniae]